MSAAEAASEAEAAMALLHKAVAMGYCFADAYRTQDALDPLRDRPDFRLLMMGLTLGKPGPEVEGPDVDGKPLKLSDHRGRVVVLTFSVDMDGPCCDAYPHYKALIERMKGRPFAILSVSLDENKRTLKNAIASGAITWRCWWEGGVERPNCERWHVGMIPSVYVIDADGIIRARDVKGKALDEAVDALMAGIEKTPARSGSNP